MSHWPASLRTRLTTYVWKPLPAIVVAQICYIPARELELTATLPPSPLQGGAIFIGSMGGLSQWHHSICNINGASFVSNTATVHVSRAAKDLESCRADLLCSWPGYRAVLENLELYCTNSHTALLLGRSDLQPRDSACHIGQLHSQPGWQCTCGNPCP
jgi:hypothetical protein